MRKFSQISINTYLNEVKPNLTAREEMVLEAIEDLGEACAESAANHIGIPINMVSGRFTGLKNKGRITAVGLRENGSGRKAMYFKSTSGVEHESVDTE